MTAIAARFLAAMGENRCGTHGPLSPREAASTAVHLAREHAAAAAIALPEPGADRVLDPIGLAAHLVAAGLATLTPSDPRWRDELPRASVGITGAYLGVVETGSLALTSAPGRPRATSLLPPVHVCLVREQDLVETFAEAVTRVAGDPLPSALTWIGGPSRTGDLEMVLTLGVHGPGVVEVVVIGDR